MRQQRTEFSRKNFYTKLFILMNLLSKIKSNQYEQQQQPRNKTVEMITYKNISIRPHWLRDFEDQNTTLFVDAVVGKTAVLPCNVEPDSIDDHVYMVLWFLKTGGRPLYSHLYQHPPKVYARADINEDEASRINATDDQMPNVTVVNKRFNDSKTVHDQIFQKLPTTECHLHRHRKAVDKFIFLADVQILVRIPGFDVRGRPFEKALHWSDPNALGDRALFMRDRRLYTAALTIQSVDYDDEGLYRCRVDFKNSPTRNIQVHLRVIAPPHQMLLSDYKGRDLAGVVGPLQVGEDYSITCELRGGRPQPNLLWYMDDKLLTRNIRLVRKEKSVIVSRLTLIDAQRDWIDRTIRCVANSSILLKGYERSARIDMLLQPLFVNITNKPTGYITAGIIQLRLTCMTQGSRPPAELSWYWNNRRQNCIQIFGNETSTVNQLRNSPTADYKDESVKCRSEVFTNETTTVNILTRTPTADDKDASVMCRAENTRLNTVAEDSFTLNLIYLPQVSLISSNGTNKYYATKEKDDAYFECIVKAFPKEFGITWYFNDSEISPDKLTKAVYTSTNNLVLKGLTKEDTGMYNCAAENSVGKAKSPYVYLKVQYVPKCDTNYTVHISVLTDQEVRLHCSMSACPSKVSFSWYFYNNSMTGFQINSARFVSSGESRSELRFMVASDRDLGIIECRGQNTIGESEKSCNYKISKATSPAKLRNCRSLLTWKNKNATLAVNCIFSYGRGVRQYFVMQIPERGKRGTLVNTTLNTTDYYARRLPEPSVWLNVSWSAIGILQDNEKVAVYAQNAVGTSAKTYITEDIRKIKLPVNEVIIVVPKDPPLPGVPIAGAVTAIVVVGVAVAVIVFYRKRRDGRAATVTATGQCPSQVQVDADGKSSVVPNPNRQDVPSRTDSAPPRVVLGSSDGKSYNLRELAPQASSLARAPAPLRNHNESPSQSEEDDDYGFNSFRPLRPMIYYS